MMKEAPRTRPPRFLEWLVDLFASADHAESLLGDLREEFLDIASKSGVVSARRWYWRHAAKTIAHLAGAAFRAAPWSLTGAVLFGFALKRFGFSLPERIIVAILHTQRPYSNLHYDFYAWVVTWGSPIVRLVEMTLIGCIVAAVAKGREIIATVVLDIVSSLIVGSLFYVATLDRPPEIPFPWIFLLRNFENWMAIVLGGILIRKIRSASLRQHSTR